MGHKNLGHCSGTQLKLVVHRQPNVRQGRIAEWISIEDARHTEFVDFAVGKEMEMCTLESHFQKTQKGSS